MWCILDGIRNVLNHHVCETGGGTKEFGEHELEQGSDIHLVRCRLKCDAERREGVFQSGRIFAQHLLIY